MGAGTGGDLDNLLQELRTMVMLLRQQAHARPTEVIYKPTREMIDQHKRECIDEWDKKIGELRQSILEKLSLLEESCDNKIDLLESVISDIRNTISDKVDSQTKPMINGAKTTHAKLEPLEQSVNAHNKIIDGYNRDNQRVPGLVEQVGTLNAWKRISDDKDKNWMEQWKFWIMLTGFFFTVAMGVLSVIFTLYKINSDMKQMEQKIVKEAKAQ